MKNKTMKAIEMDVVLGGISSLKDRSASLRFGTPELSDTEFAELRAFQNQNIHMVIVPMDEETNEVLKVEEKIDGEKPLHVQVRSSLYVLWDKKKRGQYPDFDSFYRQQMRKIIMKIQETIDL